MKSQVMLFTKVAHDVAIRCCTSHQRDCKTVRVRSKHEGVSFFTITLPGFGKDFERSLDQGYVDHDLFSGFHFRGGLPLFLGGFLDLVFDRSSGRLLDDPSIDAIHAVRQLTLLFSKVFKVSNTRRERAAMERYIECENELHRLDVDANERIYDEFHRMANRLFGRTFHGIEGLLQDPHAMVCSHGPGATADSLLGNKKYTCSWPTRLDQHFSCADHIIPNYSFQNSLEDVEFIEPEDEKPVRVISVPKTQKTPRIIAIEPTAMQYAQQGLRKLIYAKVEDDYRLRSFIGFLDQEPNQLLARKGSQYGHLATLDLSEASDRVTSRHVETLLRSWPRFRDHVFACRSRSAEVSHHGVIPLVKYASMGSALTFPLEAMVFLTIVFLGIDDELKRPLSDEAIDSFIGSVRIFGDDIIVPKCYVPSVLRRLSEFNQIVNVNKSFWTGKFRESCGKEFYAGEDVSIVKVRADLPENRSRPSDIVSTVELRNHFYKSGLWQTARYLDGLLSGILKYYPVVDETSPALGRYSFLGYETQRMCPHLHRPLVKAWRVRAPSPVNSVDGYRALLKFFIERGEEPLPIGHLERSGRPRAVNIKLGWCTPY